MVLVNHIDSFSAKASASKRGLGRMKHVMLQYMLVQDVVEKKQTRLAYVNTNSNKADLMTKCHTFEAHRKGCAVLGLKLSRDGNPLDTVTVMCDLDRVCPDFTGECGKLRTFSATSFAVSSEFTLGDNKFVPLIFFFFKSASQQVSKSASQQVSKLVVS